jgi:hypothetical protein
VVVSPVLAVTRVSIAVQMKVSASVRSSETIF